MQKHIYKRPCDYYDFCRKRPCDPSTCDTENIKKVIARLNLLSEKQQKHIARKYYNDQMPWKGLYKNENQNKT